MQLEIAALDPALGERAALLLTREVKTAPTLVKYAAPNEYAMATRRELRQTAAELLEGEPIEAAPAVDLIGGDENAGNRAGDNAAVWREPSSLPANSPEWTT